MHLNEKEIEALKKRVKDNAHLKKQHVPYAESSGRQPDFEVNYVVDIAPELIGVKLRQGMRCDFLYEGDDPERDGVHMIWPEVLDEEGNILLDKTCPLKEKGRATMWIGMHESRVKYHRPRLKVGTKGYWVVGSKKIANVEVTKILGLFENEE